ncbi:hypothetical protein SCLCIDRAFT_1214916 [Scleroderma citrinum Foug A]|uniref:Uncharacterized protein n=1 Tax=Scleroderma citrinum Foug A TaxID=1036808 RepID=A0A0C3E3E7_9AGAM|nr:hypothetical protein SCLCIDRAFT_1214916 [Scleroderma citrinum Foug A]
MRVHTDGRRKIARFNAPRSSAPALVTPIVDDDITYRRNATMRRKENDKVHTCSRGRSQGLYIDILKFNPYVIVQHRWRSQLNASSTSLTFLLEHNGQPLPIKVWWVSKMQKF